MFTKRQWKNMGIVLVISILISCLELAYKTGPLIYMFDDILTGFLLSIFIKFVALNSIYIFACLLLNFFNQKHMSERDHLVDSPILCFKEDNNVEL